MPTNLFVSTNSPQAPPKPRRENSQKPYCMHISAQSAQKCTKAEVWTPPLIPHKSNKPNLLRQNWLPSANPARLVHRPTPEFVFSAPFALGWALPAVRRIATPAHPLLCTSCTNLHKPNLGALCRHPHNSHKPHPLIKDWLRSAKPPVHSRTALVCRIRGSSAANREAPGPQ